MSKEEIIDIIKPFNQKSPSSTLTDSDKMYQAALHLLAFCKPDPNLVEHWREELTKYELSRGNQIIFGVQRISAFNFFVGTYAPSLRDHIGYKGVDALGDFAIMAFIFFFICATLVYRRSPRFLDKVNIKYKNLLARSGQQVY